jgi:hypothetical protein
MGTRSAIVDWPARCFRPQEVRGDFSEYGWMRYNETTGLFEEDNGEPAMAFYSVGGGPPFAIYVDVPYRQNILRQSQDPRYVWHYETRDGEPSFGEPYPDRDQHPNEIASRKAMDACCKAHHCANGRSVSMLPRIPFEEMGSFCAWCKSDSFGHKTDRLMTVRGEAESLVAYYQEQIEHHEVSLMNSRDGLERAEAKLERARAELSEHTGQLAAESAAHEASTDA